MATALHKADDLVVEAVKTCLTLADQLRLEGAGAIARNLDLYFAILGQHRFGAHPVAAVAAAPASRVAPLVAKMIGQLCSKRPFNLSAPFYAPIQLGAGMG